MRQLRSRVAMSIMLPLAGCMGTTECSCIAPTVVIFGNVSGTTLPVSVEARVGQGVCREGTSGSGSPGTARVEANGSYEVGVELPPPGSACIVVTASTLDLPLTTTTRRVDATVTAMPASGPQRIRVDVVVATP